MSVPTRQVVPDAFYPRLKFRYYVEFPDRPDYKFTFFSGNFVKLPKWTLTNKWKNEIEFRFYNFESKQAIENLFSEIAKTPLENKFRVNFLAPDGSTILGYWDIVGNIESIDFGDADWSNDECLSVVVKVMLETCEYTNLIVNETAF